MSLSQRFEQGFSTIDVLVGLTILSSSLALALGAQANAHRVADLARETRSASLLIQSLSTRDFGPAQSANGVSGILAWQVSRSRVETSSPVPLCSVRVEVRRPGTNRAWREETLQPCRDAE